MWVLDLEWSADLVYPEARLSEGETTYEELRLLYASELIPIQKETDAIRNELQEKRFNGTVPPIQGNQMHNPSEQSLLSGDMILPPEAHRTRSGNTQITMLMDNNYYGWNTMDALSNYYTDYDLNEVYTNWDHNNLASAIENADLVLVPYGHWVNYYDGTALRDVLANYVENGGGLLFLGYNNEEYGGLFQNSFAYTDICCGYSFSANEYDADHPIMEGLDGQMDVYRFYTSYLPNDNDAEVVFNSEWWGYEYSHSIFSKVHGSGRGLF